MHHSTTAIFHSLTYPWPGYAQRHLCPQSLYAHNVHTPNPRSTSPTYGNLPGNIRLSRVARDRNRLLHSLHPLQWVLGNATPKPTMHNPRALRHNPSLLQHLLGRTNALHPPPARHETQYATEAEMGPASDLLHGSLRHPRRRPHQSLQPLQRLGSILHAMVHARSLGRHLRLELTHDLATPPRMVPSAQSPNARPEILIDEEPGLRSWDGQTAHN